ncbi:MAG TPA: nuclear transport factor 2 family protein [Longimicrobiales bacterium]
MSLVFVSAFLRPRPRPLVTALAAIAAAAASTASAPTMAYGQMPAWTPQQSGTAAEFRGLSAAGADVAWAGGRGGVFARTTDGGRTWTADTVPGAASLFFIDAHAVDARSAYLLGTSFEGGEARIYRTTDGGEHWTLQYRQRKAGVFFDGMAFWDAERGVAFSDPVDGAFLIVTTDDGGEHWREVPRADIPPPLEGEAGFAASGTGIAVAGSRHVWIGTGGGRVARVLRSSDGGRTWTAAETPLPGGATAGIFGIAFRDTLHGVAVGGDYQDRTGGGLNVLRTDDGGRTWQLVASAAPPGVRYGVAYVPGAPTPTLVAAGPSGTGYSVDDGRSWTAIDTLGYNTIAFAGPRAGWAAGPGGRIARWQGAFAGTTARASDREAVLAVIRRLFDGMRARDTAMMRSTFHPSVRLMTAATRQGRTVVGETPIDRFLQAVGGAQEELDERIYEPEIRIDGNLATVWAFYRFYPGGRFSHCGVDAFQLARTDDGWKVIQITDTRRREGCGVEEGTG